MINHRMKWATTACLLLSSFSHFAAADSSQLSQIDWGKCTGIYDDAQKDLIMTCPGFFNVKTISIEDDVV